MSTRILAIDTTGEIGGLALVEDGRLAGQVQLHSPAGFGHLLFDAVNRLLEKNAWPRESIDCFAAAAGPGSFTGVRVGLAAAKGLAEAFGKPVVAVSNLQAIAAAGTQPLRAAFFDARRGEIYGGVFDAALEAVRAEVVAAFPAWLASLPPGDLEFLTPDPAPFRDALHAARGAAVTLTATPRELAAAVGRIAAARLTAGRGADAAAAGANYVRRSDAELFWKDD